jgi:hypothetical protein
VHSGRDSRRCGVFPPLWGVSSVPCALCCLQDGAPSSGDVLQLLRAAFTHFTDASNPEAARKSVADALSQTSGAATVALHCIVCGGLSLPLPVALTRRPSRSCARACVCAHSRLGVMRVA